MYKSYACTMLSSIECATALCLKKQPTHLNEAVEKMMLIDLLDTGLPQTNRFSVSDFFDP